MKLKVALTIAGSDCSGGAGIQADLKTMTVNGVYAMSAITALTAQNTRGVRAIQAVTPEFLAEQLDAIFKDIPPDAVKIGMVASSAHIRVIANRLRHYNAQRIVVDPVMVATSGANLIQSDAVETLMHELFPLATLVTPNLPEAQVLAQMRIAHEAERRIAAKRIGDAYHCSVLLKGGHGQSTATDWLYTDGEWICFEGERIANPNTHGTGCTLSSAITAHLAKGCSLVDAVQRAKAYVTGAIAAGLDLGQGAGPLHHGFSIQ
ncbi:MAG: bifunctional hydroxymethylpyrimidine kinase/phosphomethylpyrimidine kinase [Kiritimatiellae bacterium]|nr:bifunctional hydroxymethylpyrimidine kinase/phosphomethylpyrimidine kinase [Kiritimatiellia bacterium]